MAAVTNLAVVNNGDGTYTATWTDAVGATGYEVYLDGVLQNTVLQGVGTFSGPFSGAINFAVLPAANRQLSDFDAIIALGVRTAAAGASYEDPESGLLVIKGSSDTVPAANTSVYHDYSNGGPYLSHVWAGGDGYDRITAVISVGSGTYYLVDYIIDAGYVGNRVEWVRAAPDPSSSDLNYSFSQIAETWYYLYHYDGGIIRKYDVRRDGSEVTTAPWPKDLSAYVSASVGWLNLSADDTKLAISYDNSGAWALWDITADTVQSGGSTDVFSDGNTINELLISPSGRYMLFPSDDGNGYFKVWDRVTGFKSALYRYQDLGAQFSHWDIVWDGTNEWVISPDVSQNVNTVPIAALLLAPITAEGQSLATPVENNPAATGGSGHTTGGWVDDNPYAIAVNYCDGDAQILPQVPFSFSNNDGADPPVLLRPDGTLWRTNAASTYSAGGTHVAVRFDATNTRVGVMTHVAATADVTDSTKYHFDGTYLYVYHASDPTGLIHITRTFTVHSGNVWKCSATNSYTVGILEVLKWASGTVTERLEAVGSAGAVVDGTYYYDSATKDLYVYAASDPTGLVIASSASLLHNAIGLVNPDGLLKFGCHHYNLNIPYDYRKNTFATVNPGGRAVMFGSNMGRTSRFDQYLLVLPTVT